MNQNQQDWENEMPDSFKLAMNHVRTRSVPGESMQRFLLVTEDVEKTAARWQRANAKLTRCVMAGSILIAVGTYGLLAFSQVHILISTMVIAYLYSTLGFASLLYQGIRDLRNAGPVLMDCGKLKTEAFLMFFISIVPFAAIVFLSPSARDINQIYVIAAIAILLPISLYFVTISRGHLQVRANGIWHYIGFLPWHEIDSWGWTGSANSTLLIQKRGRWSFLKRGVLRIPDDMKEQFDDYLHQNCVIRKPSTENEKGPENENVSGD